MIGWRFIPVFCLCVLTGCATHSPQPARIALSGMTPFSVGTPGGALPGGWQTWTLAKFKKQTSYDLVHKDGATVVMARADDSASALLHPLERVDPRRYRDLAWRWKTEALIRDWGSRGRLGYDEIPGLGDYDRPGTPGFCIAIHAEVLAAHGGGPGLRRL